VFNGLALTAEPDVIREIAARPEVARVTLDAVILAPTAPAAAAASPEPNLSVINAPAVWNLGYRGQGIVVANLDTGVDVTHPDLSAQWRGGTNSWFDPNGEHPTTPTDVHGHGTWTMGVMVGRDTGGTAIGVAPEAKWIAAKIFNDAGASTLSRIHQSFQWLLDPDGNPATPDAPNVVNNSWDFGVPGCNLEFQLDLQALRAAGILPIFAAGNFGPGGSTSPSPANNPDAFAVGATDNADLLASFSSRGPTACGGVSRTYPAVVAPGVAVRSADLFGGYYSVSGTSLAAPHAAGTLALLLSAFPGTAVDRQQGALISSAVDRGPAGPDNGYGWGRIDAQAGYAWLLSGGPPPTPTPTPLPPTNTPTAAPPTNTPTAAPPTNTPTAVPPTNTPTAMPPTSTPTPIPPTATPTPRPPTATPVPDAIFANGFESGTAGAWTSITGNMSVTTGAALVGVWGAQAALNGSTASYVTDASPTNELSYHARFYFHPNAANTSGAAVTILVGRNAASTAVLRVQYRRSSGGQPQVRAGVLGSGGTQTFTNWLTITNAAHAVEVAWQSAPSASFSLSLDGTLRQTLNGLNTSPYRVDEILLGPSAGQAAGMTGNLYLDAFASTRFSTIGP
jgi:subtilisin family serine protease